MATTDKYLDTLVRNVATTCQSFIKQGEDPRPMFSLVKDNDVEMMVMPKGFSSEDDPNWRQEKHNQFWQICQLAAAIRSDAILLVCDSFYTMLEKENHDIKSWEDYENSDIPAPSEDPRARECVMVSVGNIDGSGWCVFYPYLRMDDGRIKWEKVRSTREDGTNLEGPVHQMFQQALDPEFREGLPDLSPMAAVFGFDPVKEADQVRYHLVRGGGRYLAELGHTVIAFGESIE